MSVSIVWFCLRRGLGGGTFCNGEKANTLIKVRLDWLVHQSSGLVDAGTSDYET